LNRDYKKFMDVMNKALMKFFVNGIGIAPTLEYKRWLSEMKDFLINVPKEILDEDYVEAYLLQVAKIGPHSDSEALWDIKEKRSPSPRKPEE